MVSYELAKKMKEAGFPQFGAGTTLIFKSQSVGMSTSILDNNAYAPTLEESIEACRPVTADDFGIKCDGDRWFAYFIYHGYFEAWPKFQDAEGFTSIDIEVAGATPLEAVANLYLALHGK